MAKKRHTRLRPDVPEKLTSQEQCVECDSLCQRHSNNGLDKHLAGCTRIAANCLNGFHSDETHTNGGGSAPNGALQTVVDISCNYG